MQPNVDAMHEHEWQHHVRLNREAFHARSAGTDGVTRMGNATTGPVFSNVANNPRAQFALGLLNTASEIANLSVKNDKC